MKYCLDCNKIIDKASLRCRSCSRKGIRNPMYGKKHTEKTKKIISLKKIGIPNYSNKGKKHPNYIDGRICEQQYCLDCKTPVKNINSRCNSCENKRRWKNIDYKTNFIEKRKLQIGENSPSWQGGKSFKPYPLGWTKTFKEQIRYRDGYKCQLCGCSEVENGRKLSVHHIDYDKNNLNLNNLISLCMTCHNKTNIKKKYWLEYFKQTE